MALSSAVGVWNPNYSSLSLDKFDADPSSLGPERDGARVMQTRL